MTRRKPPRSQTAALIARMKTWHIVLVFCIAAATAGAAVLAFVGRFERDYGPISTWLGLAQKSYIQAEIKTHRAEHKQELVPIQGALTDIQSEQLFFKVGILERQIAELEKPGHQRTWMEDNQLRTYKDELRRVQTKYNKLQGLTP